MTKPVTSEFESISSRPLSSLGLMNCRTRRVCDMNVYVRATEADVYSCERACEFPLMSQSVSV